MCIKKFTGRVPVTKRNFSTRGGELGKHVSKYDFIFLVRILGTLFHNTAQEAPAGGSTSSSSSDFLFLPPLEREANPNVETGCVKE